MTRTGSINSPFSKSSCLLVVVTCKKLCVFYVLSLSFKLPRVVLCACFLFNVSCCPEVDVAFSSKWYCYSSRV